jgi:hypothetical protein
VVQPGCGAGLKAGPLRDHPVAGYLPRQDPRRHGAARRDRFSLVDHPHAATADLAEDPVVAERPETRDGGRLLLRDRVLAGVCLGLFDLDRVARVGRIDAWH